MKLLKFSLTLALISTFAIACSKKEASSKPTVTVYASTYKEVLALYEPVLKQRFPDINVEFFQAGSEKVASRVSAEMAGGGTPADLIMTSDLFFYHELKDKGELLKIDNPTLAKWPTTDVDPEHMFVVTRFPVMVIALNAKKIPEGKRPKSFKDLLKPEYKGQLTMPSPLESGSTLTAALFFFNRIGPDYFSGLRKNEIVASGGNGVTLSRVKSGEKPIGIVLMENVLQDKERNKSDWIEMVVPEEGALPIPSPVAILKSTDQPVASQKVLEWFLSPEAQDLLIKGWVYSPLDGAPTPNGAPAWKDLKMQDWSLSTFKEWGGKRQEVKDLFQKTILTN